ncbi:hypothetical protein ABT336_18295 [Micromonospora sp. NPDC000207]|uniref:hypothetical protein n=1 Tax=Micromonospora sp. NPDC000207 TaxID=3154246 RepID=UPI003316ADCE
MRTLRPRQARVVAVVASLTAVALLLAVVLWRHEGTVAVGMALLCVLCTVVAGVTASASRYEPDPLPRGGSPEQFVPASANIDADTLDTFDSRDALHAVDVRQRRADRLS